MEEIRVTKYKLSDGEIFDTEEEAIKSANAKCRDILHQLIESGNLTVHHYDSNPKSTVPFTDGMTIHFVGDRTDDDYDKFVMAKIKKMFYIAVFDLKNFASYFNIPSFLEGDIFGKTYKVVYDSDGMLILDPESLEDKILRLKRELEEATK